MHTTKEEEKRIGADALLKERSLFENLKQDLRKEIEELQTERETTSMKMKRSTESQNRQTVMVNKLQVRFFFKFL